MTGGQATSAAPNASVRLVNGPGSSWINAVREPSTCCRQPGVGTPAPAAGAELHSTIMTLSGDEFLRLESLIYRPVWKRPDWLKAWRNEAAYLLTLARRAEDDDNHELLQELEDQAREMADMVEARWRAEGL